MLGECKNFKNVEIEKSSLLAAALKSFVSRLRKEFNAMYWRTFLERFFLGEESSRQIFGYATNAKFFKRRYIHIHVCYVLETIAVELTEK
jgi:hypothetical protein